MARKQSNFKKSEILEAIKKSNGIMSTIAERLGCDWHTAERNVNRFKETMNALKDEKETTIDFAENKALEAMRNGDGAMIRYYLSTMGRKRGYTENDEAIRQNNAAAKIELVLVDKPLEETR